MGLFCVPSHLRLSHTTQVTALSLQTSCSGHFVLEGLSSADQKGRRLQSFLLCGQMEITEGRLAGSKSEMPLSTFEFIVLRMLSGWVQ